MIQHIRCPHFKLCSGCSIDENVDKPPVLQEMQAYFSTKGLHNFSLHVGPPTGWRYRAKLAIRGTSQEPLIGLYREGTHDVIPIPFCKVHHPSINKAVVKLKEWIQKEQISPYDERTQRGVLRYVQLVVERSSGKVQWTLVVHQNALTEPLQRSLERLGEGEHSLWVNCNTRHDNVIFGKTWIHLCGEPLLWETIRNKKICFKPASFAQANLDLFEKMLGDIKIPPHTHLTEYYAGVGVIGLTLVDLCDSVRCCEINPEAEQCFKASREKLSSELASKISFQVGNTASMLDLLNTATVVLVDPPRKGLDRPLLEALKNTKSLSRLIYISCGWPAFQKDCEVLLAAGWTLDKVDGYLFFPGSNHIELLADFTKKVDSSQ